MGRPLERAGFLLNMLWMYILVNILRIDNKVGVIINEDLCLIDEGNCFNQRIKHSTRACNKAWQEIRVVIAKYHTRHRLHL